MSENRLLTTIAYRLNGTITYPLEGSIFIAGAVLQLLRDGLGLIAYAKETGPLAQSADPEQQVILVPAFTGLGAPYWDAEARCAIYGLTRDLMEAITADMGGTRLQSLRVDGGMTASDWTMQFLADVLDTPVGPPRLQETTALGVAWLAGVRAGLCPDQAGFAASWALDRQFTPSMATEERDRLYTGLHDAIRSTLSPAKTAATVTGF